MQQAFSSQTMAHAMTKVRPDRYVIHVLGGTLLLGAGPVTVGAPVVIDGTNTTLQDDGTGSAFVVGFGGSLTLEHVTMALSTERAVDVTGTGTLRLYNASFSLSVFDAIVVSNGGLEAREVRFLSNTGHALRCELGGLIDVSQSTFVRVGVATANCASVISRNTFHNRGSQTLRITGGPSTIENNLIVQDDELTDAVSIVGGVGVRVHFNTIVNTAAVIADGVALECGGDVIVTSNIFAYNSTNPLGGSGCAVTRSLFDLPGAGDAAGNVTADVATFFVNFSEGDFHLAPVSPALGGAEAGTVTVDLEGRSRSTSMPDIGAYEAP